jgi:hypothetical protein
MLYTTLYVLCAVRTVATTTSQLSRCCSIALSCTKLLLCGSCCCAMCIVHSCHMLAYISVLACAWECCAVFCIVLCCCKCTLHYCCAQYIIHCLRVVLLQQYVIVCNNKNPTHSNVYSVVRTVGWTPKYSARTTAELLCCMWGYVVCTVGGI